MHFFCSERPNSHTFINFIILVALLFANAAPEVAAQQPNPRLNITGYVVDEDGNSLTDYGIYHRSGAVTTGHPGSNGLAPTFRPNTDPKGEFTHRYRKGWKNKNTIVVGKAGYQTKFHIIDTGAGDSITNVRIVLEKAAEASGVILDERGNGVAGARIWLGGIPHSGHHGYRAHLTETDVQGRFFSDRFPPGQVAIGVIHADYPASTFNLELSLDGPSHPSLVLDTGQIFSGTVRIGDIPVTRGRVFAGKMGIVEDGSFMIRGIHKMVIPVGFNGFRTETTGRDTKWYIYNKKIDFSGNDPVNLDVEFPSGTANLSGRVLVDGEPTERESEYAVDVYASSVDKTDHYLQINTYANRDGNFLISIMPEGEWRVTVHTYTEELGHLYSKKRVTTRAGETTVFNVDFTSNEEEESDSSLE